MKTIVVPDIHGRTFWKDLKTKYRDFEGKIVFLGDYVDPYKDENINWPETVENLKEIIEFARNNDNVILLLGNHDYHYSYDFGLCSRFSVSYYKELHKIYTSNIDLFKIIYHDERNNILYSHAGVTTGWLKDVNIKLKDVNSLMHGDRPYDLWMVSRNRGGLDNNASPLWVCALDHHQKEDSLDDNMIQIFGHTQLSNDYLEINPNKYCIDSRQLFIVDNRSINILK